LSRDSVRPERTLSPESFVLLKAGSVERAKGKSKDERRYDFMKHTLVLVSILLLFLPSSALRSEAKDLTDVLVRGFSFSAFGKDTSASARAVAPAFSSAIAQAVTQEFPFASVTPAFIYRYNPAVDIYERLTGIPGPLFSERAPTLGKGRFNLGVGYAYIDFSDLNGTDLDNINSPALLNELFLTEGIPFGQLSTGEPTFLAPVSASLIRTGIDLQAYVIVPTLRYGITDNWDVSLSIPIVNTSLRIRNEVKRVADVDFSRVGFAFAGNNENSLRPLGFFDRAGNPIRDLSLIPLVKSQRSTQLLRKASGSATGVGDITLRSKYYLWQQEFGGAALGLNLQLPSGEVQDFHGTDETHLTTFLYLSQVLWERFEPHLNVGVDFNADDVDRSSFVYTAGTVFLMGEKLGVIIDFLGRVEFSGLSVRVPPEGIYTQGLKLNRPADTCTTTQPCAPDLTKGFRAFPFFPEKIQRNDLADFSFGLRYALGASGSIFFGGVIPLNDDGFRPDFIPAGGIEYTF